MKKSLLFLMLMLACVQPFMMKAQSNSGLIVMTAFVPTQDGLTETSKKSLEHKISQLITASGMGSIDNSRFAVIPRVVLADKRYTSGAPQMIVMDADVTFYIGDVETGNVYGSYTKNVKGVGETDTRAYISAIGNIKPKDAELQAFMQAGKQKIIDYYNQKVDQIINRARQFESQSDYDGALAALLEVPEEAVEAYAKVSPLIASIYQKKIDYEGEILYNQAYQIWNSTLNYDGAVEACGILAQISPYSKAAPKARTLSDNIGKRVREIDKREWNFIMQEQKNEADFNKALISAARDIGVAQAKQPIYNYNVVWW